MRSIEICISTNFVKRARDSRYFCDARRVTSVSCKGRPALSRFDRAGLLEFQISMERAHQVLSVLGTNHRIVPFDAKQGRRSKGRKERLEPAPSKPPVAFVPQSKQDIRGYRDREHLNLGQVAGDNRMDAVRAEALGRKRTA